MSSIVIQAATNQEENLLSKPNRAKYPGGYSAQSQFNTRDLHASSFCNLIPVKNMQYHVLCKNIGITSEGPSNMSLILVDATKYHSHNFSLFGPKKYQI